MHNTDYQQNLASAMRSSHSALQEQTKTLPFDVHEVARELNKDRYYPNLRAEVEKKYGKTAMDQAEYYISRLRVKNHGFTDTTEERRPKDMKYVRGRKVIAKGDDRKQRDSGEVSGEQVGPSHEVEEGTARYRQQAREKEEQRMIKLRLKDEAWAKQRKEELAESDEFLKEQKLSKAQKEARDKERKRAKEKDKRKAQLEEKAKKRAEEREQTEREAREAEVLRIKEERRQRETEAQRAKDKGKESTPIEVGSPKDSAMGGRKSSSSRSSARLSVERSLKRRALVSEVCASNIQRRPAIHQRPRPHAFANADGGERHDRAAPP